MNENTSPAKEGGPHYHADCRMYAPRTRSVEPLPTRKRFTAERHIYAALVILLVIATYTAMVVVGLYDWTVK